MTIRTACMLPAISLLFLLRAAAFGAGDFGMGDAPGIKIDFSGARTGDAAGKPREYFDRGASVSAGFPLLVLRRDRSFVLFDISSSLGVEQVEASFLSRPLQFYDAKIAAGLSVKGSGREAYLLRLGAKTAEERETMGRPLVHFSLLGMGTYRRTPDLTYLYGLSYSYVFGKELFFPVLGMNWSWSARGDLSAVLPVFFRLGYRVSPATKATFYSSLSGNQFHFRNNGDFPGAGDSLQLRTMGLRLGAGIEYRMRAGWTVGADIAADVRREMKVSEAAADLASQEAARGPCVRVFSQWSFAAKER